MRVEPARSVASRPGERAVVVISAHQGVTDLSEEVAHAAATGRAGEARVGGSPGAARPDLAAGGIPGVGAPREE